MDRFVITLLTSALFSTSVLGADTFASQLRNCKHIGLSIDKRLAAFTIHVYTPKQYSARVASLKAFHREREAFNEHRAGYRRGRVQARERRASTDELNAMTAKRNHDMLKPPFSPFEKHIQLNTVESFGEDYIAIAPLEEPNQKILIPFHRVGRVIVTTEDKSSSDAPEPK